MIFEYLLYNLIVAVLPLVGFSYYLFYLKERGGLVLRSVLLSATPFLIWDGLVEGFFWSFNEQYTMPFRIAGLPIGEVMFFFTTPLATLFLWELALSARQIYHKNFKASPKSIRRGFTTIHHVCNSIVVALFLMALFFTILAKMYYTMMICISCIVTILMGYVLKINVLYFKKSIYFVLYVLIALIICNGYLAGRPIVLYNDDVHLGYRVFFMPIEDIFYGFSFLYLTIIFYEKLKLKKS